MCYAVFIATLTPKQTSEFIADVTKLYLQLPDTEQIEALRSKLTLPYIYYVGSDTGCSCGFEFHSELYDDPEWQDSKESPQALLDLIDQMTIDGTVEYYCCWDGDWDDEKEHVRMINIKDIKLNTNYFELIEREFIRFEGY